MNNKIKLKQDELNGMTPAQLVEDERVEQKFVQLYNAFHGSEMGANIYAKEKFNFLKLVQENPALKACTRLSLYGCFLDVAYMGLSIEQCTQPHAYVLPYNVNVGTKDNPKWEKRASLSITGYGELVRRIRAGHVKHADNPVIVYGSDDYGRTTTEKGTVITHKRVRPITDKTIIAGFIRLIRTDGSVEFAFLEEEDIERLKGYSTKKNKGKTNPLYTSNSGQIDTGFLKAKVIKHAFSSFPKLKVGEFSTIHEEDNDDSKPDYGIEEAEVVKPEPEDPQAFGEQPEDVQEPETVVIESDEEETF